MEISRNRKTITLYDQSITFGYGSSTGYPDFKGMQTSDRKLWMKYNDGEWFKVYANFKKVSIVDMFANCHSKHQVLELMSFFRRQRSDIYWFINGFQIGDHEEEERCFEAVQRTFDLSDEYTKFYMNLYWYKG